MYSNKLKTGVIEAVSEIAKNLIEQSSLNSFCLDDTKLFKILVEFHAGLVNLEFTPIIHDYDLLSFILRVIADLYTKIVNSEYFLEDKFSSHLEKTVQEHFADLWLVLEVLLISCGDMYIHETPENGKRVDLVSSCKRELRNPVMHQVIRLTNFNFEIVNKLCQEVLSLSQRGDFTEIDWDATEYRKLFLQKSRAVQQISKFGIFPKPINETIVDYVGYIPVKSFS